MKLTAKKSKLFTGDEYRKITYKDDNGVDQIIMNIVKDKGVYHNDINCRIFKTINEAKEYCIENFNQFVKG